MLRHESDLSPNVRLRVSDVPLVRRLLAEFLGTALLVTVVVGSGIAAQQLSPNDIGLQLLENSTATVFGLAVLIVMFGPVSGAHFNPVISLVDYALGRRYRRGLDLRAVIAYVPTQIAGAVAGAWLANAMFSRSVFEVSTKHRASGGHVIAEIVATAGLVTLIFALARTGRASLSAPCVGAYIGAAYWFTSSTSFANPAVTIGRIFSDTFAGIAPSSVPGFIGAQIVGAAVGVGVVVALYPHAGRAADDVVFPATEGQS
jgi:glycerol uptake facilitator-like aquaporin